MKQATFASLAFDAKKIQTRRERFLGEMDRVIPWPALLALFEKHYPTSGRRGRPPMGVERMLRIHFLQQWYALGDLAMEEALYEIESMRRFAGIELNENAIPDETTILKFRRLLEKHQLGAKLLTTVNAYLGDQGLMLRQGTIIDATIIAAPSSTKNASGARDPEMHQTKKGNQWYFGLKAHIGVDRHSGLVHTVKSTAANEADVTHAADLLHGEETRVFADAGYTGAQKRVGDLDREIDWHVAEKRGRVKALNEGDYKDAVVYLERLRASVRARVEHPFRVIKRQFGYMKVRYRGLAKNGSQVETLFALSNLWMARHKLAATG
jgi:IS5 family transposase